MLNGRAKFFHETFEDLKSGREEQQSAGAGHNSGDFDFEDEPLPLYRDIPKGEEFPVDALGRTLGDMARALHETAVQSPLAICGTAVLAAAALSAQAHRDIVLPAADGLRKPISLNFLAIALSGERKSATDTMALKPVQKRTDELLDDYERHAAEYKNALDVWTAQRSRILKEMKGDSKKAKFELDHWALAKSAPEAALDGS